MDGGLRVVEGGDAIGLAGLSGIAAELLACDDPAQQPDAFRFAWICDLSFRHTDGDPLLAGDWICYDGTRCERQQQHDVAACVAEWLLRNRDLPVSPFAIQYLVGQMLASRSSVRIALVVPCGCRPSET